MADRYGPWYDDEGEPHHAAPGRRTLRDLVGEASFRYQTARLGTRVAIDVAAAVTVMAVVVGAAVLLLRDPGPSNIATAGPTTTSTAVATTVPTTTTTVASDDGAADDGVHHHDDAAPGHDHDDGPRPRPRSRRRPRPRRPPRAEPSYRSCDEARQAGATLPIPEGSPGYRRSLDPDRDGLACEADEDDWDWILALTRRAGQSGSDAPSNRYPMPGSVMK